MDTETKKLLARWQALEKDGALQHVAAKVRALGLVGLGLCFVVVFAVFYRLHPVFVAAPAVALGWVVAESNALRTRLAQWPIIKGYIDWKRVDEDLRR